MAEIHTDCDHAEVPADNGRGYETYWQCTEGPSSRCPRYGLLMETPPHERHSLPANLEAVVAAAWTRAVETVDAELARAVRAVAEGAS